MPDQSPLDDLLQQEAADRAAAQQVIGENKVTTEQDTAQAAIDARNAQKQPTVAELMDRSSYEPGWAKALGDFQDSVTDTLGSIPGDIWSGFSRAAGNIIGALPGTDAASWRQAGEDLTTASSSSTAEGRAVSGLSQFLLGFMPAARAAKALGAGSVVANTLASGAAGMADFSPEDPRLSNLIQAHPALANPITEFLATQPGDSDAEGRLKNGLEQATLGLAGDLLLNGVGSVFKAMRATKSINDLTAAVEAAPSTPVEMPTETPVTPEAPPQETSGATASTDVAPPVTSGTADATAAVTEGAPQASPFNAEEFVKSETARLGVDLPAEKQEAILQAIRDGQYSDVGGMLDDTHRTIPWDQMSDGDNLKQLFNSVEGVAGDLIKEAHGTGAVSSDQIEQLAKALGGDTDNVAKLYADTSGGSGLAARITAGYNILLASGRQLRTLAKAAYSLDPATPEGAQAVLDFQKQLTLHAGIVGQVRQSSAEIGRALWAHRALKASSDVALTNIKDYAGTQLGTKALKKLAEQITNSGDLASLTNAADAVRQRGWKDVVREVALNGMLSGPKTQLANLIGNAGNGLLKIAERYVAAGIGSGQRLLGIGSAPATFREAWAHTLGSAEGLRVAWKLAAKAVKDEDFASAFSQQSNKAIYADTTGRTGMDLTGRQVLNLAGQTIRLPSRVMGILDHFTQAVGYHGDLAARSYVQAAKEADAQGLDNVARDSFMQNRVAELRANPTTELRQQAMNTGKYSAFLEDPQTATGGNISKALNQSPMLKLIVAPFTHRPGNMLRQAMFDYTPLSPLIKSNRQALMSGTSDASVAAARVAIGTSLLLEGLHQAQQGNLTGNRTASQNTELLDGIPKYSAKIGGKWLKFDRLDPVGTWLGIGGDMHEFFTHHYDPTDPHGMSAAQMAVQSAVQTLGNVAFDKSFLKSVDEITSAMHSQDPDRADIATQRVLTENVSKLLPFSGALGSVAQAMDPTQRASARGSILDGVIARLPGMTEQLPPRRDLLGRPMPVVSSWNPLGMATESGDPMDKALSALAVHVNAPPRSIDGYTLNAQEYDSVIQRATQSPIFGGQTLEEKLRDLTASDAWATNAQAPDGGVLRNGKEVQKLIDGAYSYGRESYQQDHPDLVQEKVAEQRAKIAASRPQSFLSGVANEPQPTQASAQ